MMKYCKKCECDTERGIDGACKPCMRKRAAAWREKNRDRHRATSAAWVAANPEKAAAARKARYASNAEKYAASAKAWREANREKERARKREYNAANREKLRQSKHEWAKANPDKLKEYAAKYRAANKEKRSAYDAKWLSENHERKRFSNAEWKASNGDLLRTYDHNRRARKRADGGKLSPGLAARLFKLQRGKCACGCKQPLGDDYHLDHIMPLALGGTNTDDNIQLLTATCNLRKSAKHPVDFMQQRGYLI